VARPILLNIITLSALLFNYASANASDVQQIPDAVEQDGSFQIVIASDDTVHVLLPDTFSTHSFDSIVVEFDQIDITEMVELSEGTLTYQPSVELEAGQHQLVITNLQSGEEFARWHINVQYSEASETNLAIDSQFIANQRIAEKNIGDPEPKRFHGQANSQVGFSHVNNSWQVQGAFDLYYDSIEENRFSERTIDNGEFLVSISNQYAEAHIGHQVIGNGSLVMDNFSRRGVSVAGNIAAVDSKVSGFSLSSPEIYGFGGGLGIGDSRQRVDGVYFESSPVTEQPSLLTISGTWIEAEINSQDDYIAQPFVNGGGSVGESWSFSTESLLLEDKIHFITEYARSEFDLDRSDNIEPEEDDAYKIGLSYSDVTDNQVAWSLGANKQQVGTFFQSIANQGLATDKHLFQWTASLQSESTALQLSSEVHKDNIESIELLPTIKTQHNNLALSWSPTLEYSSSWLGAPSFTLAIAEQDQTEIKTPQNSPVSIGNEVFNWQVTGHFSYEVNSWGINLSNTDFIDRTGFQSDSNTFGVSVFSNLVFGERATFSASIGMDEIDDLTLQVSSKSLNYAVQTFISIIPSELDLSFDYSINQNETSDLLINGSNSSVNFSLNWKLMEQAVNQFGIDLSLSSAYNDFDDKLMALNSLESHQSFITLTATLPARLGNSE
jgi:hypothetical protein